MRTLRLESLVALLAALAVAGCGATQAAPAPLTGTIEARIAAPPIDVRAILVTVTGSGIPTPIATTLTSQEGRWSGRLLNVPPGTGRVLTAYAYAVVDVPADPEADTTGLIYRGARTNLTVSAGALTAVTVPLLPWPDGGGEFGVNTPPHITSMTHATAMASNATSTFTALAVDPDPSALLTYAWSDEAGGSFAGGDVGDPAVFSNREPGTPVAADYTPPAGFVGRTTIRVVVTDGIAFATTTFPIGVGSGIDVGLVFDVLPEIDVLGALTQDLAQGADTFVDWQLAYPAGAGPDAPSTLEVSAAWSDDCGGSFWPPPGSLLVDSGQATPTQRTFWTAPVTGAPDTALCTLKLTVSDAAGAEVYSDVRVWVNPPPPPPERVIFITSTEYNGALGGLQGADLACQQRADLGVALGVLPAGSYRALLGDTSIAPVDRLPAGSWVLPGGIPVAATKYELAEGTIQHLVEVNELGQLASGLWAWSGSVGTGNRQTDPGYTCSDWTDANPLLRGNFGRNEYLDYAWLSGSHGPCDLLMRLYCVQVDQFVNVNN